MRRLAIIALGGIALLGSAIGGAVLARLRIPDFIFGAKSDLFPQHRLKSDVFSLWDAGVVLQDQPGKTWLNFSGKWEPEAGQSDTPRKIEAECFKAQMLCSVVSLSVKDNAVHAEPQTFTIETWGRDTIVATHSDDCREETLRIDLNNRSATKEIQLFSTGLASPCGGCTIPAQQTVRLLDRDGKLLKDDMGYRPRSDAQSWKAIRWTSLPTPVHIDDHYPERAHDDEVEGSGEIECLLLPDGRAADCYVIHESPKGYGFGPATQRVFERYAQAEPGSLKPETYVRYEAQWKLEKR